MARLFQYAEQLEFIGCGIAALAGQKFDFEVSGGDGREGEAW